ncbi:response regulator transcription factor [Actinoplanes sp. NPDC051475]|uniref:response regulator transcription factor n=1 Tax=Actinoplanes sp. NPDC051475 TaxID=3157225 RepID=UPI00344F3C9A
MDKVKVAVHATDPVDRAGLLEYVERSPDLVLAHDDGEIRLVRVEQPPDATLATLREPTGVDIPTVLIGEVPSSRLIAVLEAGVMAVIPAKAASPQCLTVMIRAALAGEMSLPPRLVTELVQHLRRLQDDVLTPNGLSVTGLATREVDILRLLAEGLDTAEIAVRLNYAERTVKKIVTELTKRLQVRNRTHAVAVALRNGLL